MQEGISLEDVSAVDEEVKRVLLWQLDSLADDETELVCGQVGGGKIPNEQRNKLNNWYTWDAGAIQIDLLVSLTLWQLGRSSLLTDDRDLVRVLLSDLCRLFSSLLYSVTSGLDLRKSVCSLTELWVLFLI